MCPPVTRLKLVVLLSLTAVAAAAYLNSAISYTKSADPPAPQAGQLRVCQNAQPFPRGFDYPQTASTIQRWVTTRDEGRAREHGWYLFAALNQLAGDGWPVWRSWCTSTQAFDAGTTGATALSARPPDTARPANRHLSLNAKRFVDGPTTGEDPINFPNPPYYPVPERVKAKYGQCVEQVKGAGGLPAEQLRDGPVFQNNGDVMVAGVIYNDAAYRWIRDKKLYLASTLNPQVPPPNVTRQMAEMPPGSIVLKPMMWPVRGDGYTALPVWDDLKEDDGRYVGFEIQRKWRRAVAVSPRAQPGARVSVEYLYGVYNNGLLGRRPLGPIRYADAEVVPVERFYHLRFPDLDTMNPCDRAILDASAYWAYNREFRREDYLVLIAMHVMTKEQPNWTFQSAWWHDRPDVGPYAADRPDIRAAGPWRHYLLTSTYGITSLPAGHEWPIAYNPYIELAADHPIATNCMNCHHRAAWPNNRSSYEATKPGAPNALEVFSMNNPVFNGLLTLDAMWAISDRAGSPPAATAPARRRRR